MVTHKSEFALFEIVYLKTDPDQHKRIITYIGFPGSGGVMYNLALGDLITTHSEGELSRTKDETIKFN